MHDITRSLSSALCARDRSTRQHCDRVVELSQELGIHLELSQRELDMLKLGAQCHDIGKIGIPDRILHKAAPFDQDERAAMQAHPAIGQQIVLSIADEQAVELGRIVRHHHENFDGSGYPDQLAGEDIPLAARIIALVDNYDAMAVSRPYHGGRSHRDIISILDSESRKFDPDLLYAFRHLIEHSPLRAA
ncbi:MAG: HD domain-containing protein [Azonexaceae bacterium]|nr:HD domain-containing protein [Azonexaceae bacterium]